MDFHQISDLRQYTKRFLVEFIELYKSQPTLWQIKSADYRDRRKKATAYDLLVRKCRQVEPECDKEKVVKKINSLRTCYRKEYKKVQRSLKEGAGEVYKPRLWYYNLLSFLNDSIVSGESFVLFDEDAAHSFNETQSDPLTFQSESQTSLSESPRSSPVPMFVSSEPTPSLKMRLRTENTDTKKRTEEDEFDLLGRLYASKLRKLKRDQRIYAEKIINDTLFEAELGNLNRECHLIIERKAAGPEIELKAEAEEVDLVDTSFIDGDL